MESLELTREQRDGILQITEVLENGFSYTTELQEPIAQYVGIYLLGAYYEEYYPNNSLTNLRPNFRRYVALTFNEKKMQHQLKLQKFRKTFPILHLW